MKCAYCEVNYEKAFLFARLEVRGLLQHVIVCGGGVEAAFSDDQEITPFQKSYCRK